MTILSLFHMVILSYTRDLAENPLLHKIFVANMKIRVQ